MKKSVIIGSLVAGAFLLPAIASAGVATGRCDKCHTMHASQNGVTATPNQQLLIGSGCIGCHAEGAVANSSVNGKGGTKNAPQVDDPSGWAGTSLAGGYFTRAGSDWDGQHNVSGLTNADTVFGTGLTQIPGNAAIGTMARITCEDCHRSAGHHTDGGYRMLSYGATAVAGTEPANYGVSINRAAAEYDGTTMNGFCDSCHPDFHGTVGDAEVGSYGSWIRHPVNITLGQADAATAGKGASIDYVSAYTTGPADHQSVTPISATSQVMCLSCHLAHGGAENVAPTSRQSG